MYRHGTHFEKSLCSLEEIGLEIKGPNMTFGSNSTYSVEDKKILRFSIGKSHCTRNSVTETSENQTRPRGAIRMQVYQCHIRPSRKRKGGKTLTGNRKLRKGT